jgi:hypothetical protein
MENTLKRIFYPLIPVFQKRTAAWKVLSRRPFVQLVSAK